MKRVFVAGVLIATSLGNQVDAQVSSAPPVIHGVVSLQRAEQLAARLNPDIRAAEAAQVSAQAGVAAADSAFRPQLSVNLFVSGGSESAIMSSTAGVMPSQQMLLGRGAFADQNAVVMLPLWAGGGRRAAAGQARWTSMATAADVLSARREVQLEVADEYAAIPAQDALLTAAHHRLKSATAHLANDRLGYSQGAQPLLTVRRDETEYADAQRAVSEALRDKALAVNRLIETLGVDPASTIETAQATTTELSVIPALKELEVWAVANRPEVSNATLKVKAALSGISVRRAAFAPQLSLFAMGDVMQQHRMPGFAGTAFGITASIAVTNGGMRRAAVKDAEGALAGARAMQQKAVQQVTRQVKDAYVQLKSAQAELVAAKAAVASSTEAYQEELQRFGAGRSTDADVLEALAARTSAEYGEAEARFALQSAYYQLMYAAGRPIAGV